MNEPHDTLDQIAIQSKTVRQVLIELLTNDWNLRKDVMRAGDHEVFHARYEMKTEFPMSVAKKVLPDLLPME